VSSIFKESYLSVTYKGDKSSYPRKFCKYIFSEFPKNAKVLDVGCGNGDFTLEMKKLGLDVYGIDINDSSHLEGNFLKVDIQNERYPFPDGHFDIVFSKSVIEHLREPDFLFDEVNRVLKSDGTFICLTPSWKHAHKEQFYIDHTHVTPFTRYSLAVLCEMSGFEAKCSYLYQLPFLWKYPFLTPFVKLFSMLPIPYRPFSNIPWTESINKLIRFSKEVMLISKVKKNDQKN
jgi:SAM-dependent methyltransferase